MQRRFGFSLLELLLALALTALVTVLLGQLMQNYIAQTSGPVERSMMDQEARKILVMISDDIRGVVRNQAFDAAALQQIIGSPQAGGGGGAGAGGGGGGGGVAGGGASPAASSPTSIPSGMQGPSLSSTSSGGSSAGATPTAGGGGTTASPPSTSATASTASAYPPGVYGTSTALEIDISRIPRPDQYFVDQTGLGQSKLVDVPSDTKTVSYFVQVPTTMGVEDLLSSTATGSGGLVRRQIDRSIAKWASEQGRTDQLNRTGELISTSVIGLEFSYFNGSQWSYSWDSSVEGLPWVIRITVAMQDPIKAKDNPISPGTDVTTMDATLLAEYGVHTYSTSVAIPGAMLLSAPPAGQPTGSADTGMGSLGL